MRQKRRKMEAELQKRLRQKKDLNRKLRGKYKQNEIIVKGDYGESKNTKDFDRVRLVLKIGQKDFFMMLLEKNR